MTTQAAIYLRISSDRQDAANQRFQVEALCAARGYVVDPKHVFVVTERGDAERNPTKEACREAARRGEVSVIVTWALDRWSRRGISDLLRDVAQLRSWGCGLVSVMEPWCDSSSEGGAAELLLAISAWLARQEKLRLAERNRATAARLKAELAAKGKLLSKRGLVFTKLGRRPVHVSAEALRLAQALRAQPGTRYRRRPMGWPSIVEEIRRQLGEAYTPTTLARAVAPKIGTSDPPTNTA